MKRGYRWVNTGYDAWQFEAPPASRRFHGAVKVLGDGTASFSVGGVYGERGTVRAAKDEVERRLEVPS